MANKVARKNLGLLSSNTYQIKRKGATEKRWQILSSYIATTPAQNLLDIGCNLGELSVKAAEDGLFVIGVDSQLPFIQAARKKHAKKDQLGFMSLTISPENIQILPQFDIILCLSVHHHWVHCYGEETAQKMLESLGEKARYQLFFEPPSRKKRYGDFPPPIQDLDQDSIVDYNLTMLRSLWKGKRDVKFIGATECVGEREPYRYMFLVETPKT